jgi:MFS family permease
MEPRTYPSPGRAWYAVGVLTLIYVFSFIDRQILNLLVRPIRRDLGISDTEMSLLMGFSFAVFYTFFGILMGRLADSRSRRGLIAAGCILWSALTAGCGLARNYTQMLLLRMGVGVGEASLSPAAYSLITDYFPPHRLATAISVYSMGIYLGTGLAYLLGGAVISFATAQELWNLPVVGATRPWQVIFFLVGLPGIALAALLATVPEPVRAARKGAASFAEFWGYVKLNRATFLCHNFGFALLSFSSYATAAWLPTFFTRHHGWEASTIGVWFGAIIMVFGTAGIVAGGWLADWLRARGRRDAVMLVGMLVALIWVPSGVAVFLVSSPWWSLVAVAMAQFFASAPFGVAPAAIQQMSPPHLRGQASAVYLFVINLIGLGVGPTAVAITTDYVFHDDNLVGMSLLLVTSVAHALSGLLLWRGLRPFEASLARNSR